MSNVLSSFKSFWSFWSLSFGPCPFVLFVLVLCRAFDPGFRRPQDRIFGLGLEKDYARSLEIDKI